MAQPEQREAADQTTIERFDTLLHTTDTVFGFKKLPDDFGNDAWKEEEAESRALAIRERAANGGLTFADIQQYHVDHARNEVFDVLFDEKGMPRPDILPQERTYVASQEVFAAKRISLVKALDQYMHVLQTYRRSRTELRLTPDEKMDAAITDEYAAVTQLATQRIDVARKLTTEQNPEKKMTLAKQAIEIERTLISRLASGETNVAERVLGRKPELAERGLPPAYLALIRLIEERYEKNYEAMKELQGDNDTPDMQDIKTRIEGAQEKILLAYRNAHPEASSMTDIPQEEAKKLLEPEYDQYAVDLALLQLSAGTTETKMKKFQEQNAKLLELLTGITMEAGLYEIHRAKLASLQSAPAYLPAENGDRELPGIAVQPQDKPEAEDFLRDQRTKAIGDLKKHITFVDEQLLREGFSEGVEDRWNEDGREFAVWLADFITRIETGWIPTESLRGWTRDKMMEGMYDALGWPRDERGIIVPWKELKESDKQRMREKQKSTLDAIRTFRGENAETGEKEKEDPVTRLKGSIGAAELFMSGQKEYLAPQSSPPEAITPEKLLKETVTAENLDALIQKHGALLVGASLYAQLEGQWKEYGDRYGALLQNIHEVIGVHLDWGRLLKDFGRTQAMAAGLLAALAGVLFVAGWAGLALAPKAVKLAAKAVKGTVKGGVQTVKAVGKGAKAMRGVTKGGLAAAGAGLALELGVLYSITPSTKTESVRQAIALLEDLETQGKSLPYQEGGSIVPSSSAIDLSGDSAHLEEMKETLAALLEVHRMRDVVHALREKEGGDALKNDMSALDDDIARYTSELSSRFPIPDDMFGTSPIVGDTVRADFGETYMTALHRREERVSGRSLKTMQIGKEKPELFDPLDLAPLRERFLRTMRRRGVLPQLPEL